MSNRAQLDEKTILAALGRLSERLAATGERGEICIVGGACLVLAFKARIATKDVDAMTFAPDHILREAFRVGQEMGLPPDWFNGAARLYISRKKHETREFNMQFPNLRVLVPTAEYMLAMKCLASRAASVAGAADDRADIKFLVQHLNLKSAGEALRIAEQFYPLEKLPPVAPALLESIFNELKREIRKP